MRDDEHKFLMLRGHFPARLTTQQVAWLLNCHRHDIPALVAAKLLKPLGNPPLRGIKYFSTKDLQDACEDRHWLTRVSAIIYQHWQIKNMRARDDESDLEETPNISNGVEN